MAFIEAGKTGVSTLPLYPDNTFPDIIVSGKSYEAKDNGYAISNYYNLSPNAAGALVTNGLIYQATRSGYAFYNKPVLTQLPGATPFRQTVPYTLSTGNDKYFLVVYAVANTASSTHIVAEDSTNCEITILERLTQGTGILLETAVVHVINGAGNRNIYGSAAANNGISIVQVFELPYNMFTSL